MCTRALLHMSMGSHRDLCVYKGISHLNSETRTCMYTHTPLKHLCMQRPYHHTYVHTGSYHMYTLRLPSHICTLRPYHTCAHRNTITCVSMTLVPCVYTGALSTGMHTRTYHGYTHCMYNHRDTLCMHIGTCSMCIHRDPIICMQRDPITHMCT